MIVTKFKILSDGKKETEPLVESKENRRLLIREFFELHEGLSTHMGSLGIPDRNLINGIFKQLGDMRESANIKFSDLKKVVGILKELQQSVASQTETTSDPSDDHMRYSASVITHATVRTSLGQDRLEGFIARFEQLLGFSAVEGFQSNHVLNLLNSKSKASQAIIRYRGQEYFPEEVEDNRSTRLEALIVRADEKLKLMYSNFCSYLERLTQSGLEDDQSYALYRDVVASVQIFLRNQIGRKLVAVNLRQAQNKLEAIRRFQDEVTSLREQRKAALEEAKKQYDDLISRINAYEATLADKNVLPAHIDCFARMITELTAVLNTGHLDRYFERQSQTGASVIEKQTARLQALKDRLQTQQEAAKVQKAIEDAKASYLQFLEREDAYLAQISRRPCLDVGNYTLFCRFIGNFMRLLETGLVDNYIEEQGLQRDAVCARLNNLKAKEDGKRGYRVATNALKEVLGRVDIEFSQQGQAQNATLTTPHQVYELVCKLLGGDVRQQRTIEGSIDAAIGFLRGTIEREAGAFTSLDSELEFVRNGEEQSFISVAGNIIADLSRMQVQCEIEATKAREVAGSFKAGFDLLDGHISSEGGSDSGQPATITASLRQLRSAGLSRQERKLIKCVESRVARRTYFWWFANKFRRNNRIANRTLREMSDLQTVYANSLEAYVRVLGDTDQGLFEDTRTDRQRKQHEAQVTRLRAAVIKTETEYRNRAWRHYLAVLRSKSGLEGVSFAGPPIMKGQTYEGFVKSRLLADGVRYGFESGWHPSSAEVDLQEVVSPTSPARTSVNFSPTSGSRRL
jgi:hypothetical protein